jgi:hypothetical protein
MKTVSKYYNEGLIYPCTNESNSSVVNGLCLRSSDIAISVCASGDMPFSIAPHVKRVYAVDNNLSQIDFAEEQRELLSRGLFEKFYRKDMRDSNRNYDVYTSDFNNRENYFEKNMEIIVSSLDKIIFVNEDIFDFARNFKEAPFDKIYLSNILDYAFLDGIIRRIPQSFEFLKKDGLVYDSFRTERRLGRDIFKESKLFELHNEGTLDSVANRINGGIVWDPKVYRKK